MLSDLEIAGGSPLGFEPGLRPAPLPDHHRTVREVLDDLLREALTTTPCAVSFSGGRDSSALLAAATRLARAEGLPIPSAVTLVIPNSEQADEGIWQRAVLSHLGIKDWHRVELREELDVVGPLATDILRRHGVMWPFNAHLHAPLFRLVEGGSLITGFGGDEIFDRSAEVRLARVARGRRRPSGRDLATLALSVSPRPLWIAAAALKRPHALPWLTPRGQRAFNRGWASTDTPDHLGYGRTVREFWASRYRSETERSLAAVASDSGVTVVNPIVDPRFVGTVAKTAGPFGLGGRSAAMAGLFGDLLPAEVTSRGTKAVMDDGLWGPHARRFAETVHGNGLNDKYVDVRAIVREWKGRQPHILTATALQACWFADNCS